MYSEYSSTWYLRRLSDEVASHPANPNIGLKEQFEELQKQRQVQQEQLQEYAEQMKRLQESAQRSRASKEEAVTKRSGWLW